MPVEDRYASGGVIMKLIYPLFPLMGQGNSPPWCAEVVKAADARGDVVYDIRVPFRQQAPLLLEALGHTVLKPSRQKRLRAVLGAQDAQDLLVPLNGDHLHMFDADHFGTSVVARDLYVLARAAIVIVDANTPGYGEHLITATYAHLFGCRVWVVNDRHVLPPFLGEIASLLVSSTKVASMIVTKRRVQHTVTTNEVVEHHAVDPFDDPTG